MFKFGLVFLPYKTFWILLSISFDLIDFFATGKESFKGFASYIFTTSFFKSKREHLSNKEKCFLFHFKSSFRSRENQILEFTIFKFHDVIKCLSIKQEIHFTEYGLKQATIPKRSNKVFL